MSLASSGCPAKDIGMGDLPYPEEAVYSGYAPLEPLLGLAIAVDYDKGLKGRLREARQQVTSAAAPSQEPWPQSLPLQIPSP